MSSNIQYLLYVDNLPTKAIHNTLSETQASARYYQEEKKPLMITTVNSPNPVQTWNFDYTLKIWIEKK